MAYQCFWAPTTKDAAKTDALCLVDTLPSLWRLYAAVGAGLEAREGRCGVLDGLLYIFIRPALSSMQDYSIELLEASSLMTWVKDG